MAATPGAAQDVANLKKWHSSHIALLRQAVVCALDLADTPSNAETKVVFLKVELKPDHAKLQPNNRYYPVGGFDLTRDEARGIFPPGSGTILDAGLASHEHMKKKGTLGVTQLLLEAHGLVDIISIALPSLEGAKKARATTDWGQNWVAGLQMALEMGYTAEPLCKG
jgi:hypothetical protein